MIFESMKKLRLWSLAAAVCLVAAIISWGINRADASFVFATLGVLAWFLNLRVNIYQPDEEREAVSDERVEREE